MEILPATILAIECYQGMFNNCQSLVKAPELPAPELVSNCYNRMFLTCKALNEIKVGFTQWSDATFEWVRGVSATGSFIRPSKDLEVVYGISNIPEGWTVNQFEQEQVSATDLIVSGAYDTNVNGTYKLIAGNANDLTGRWQKGEYYIYCQDPSYPDPWIITTYQNYNGSPWVNPYYKDANGPVTGQWLVGSASEPAPIVYFASNENTEDPEEPTGEIAYIYDIVVSDCGVQKLNGVYKLVDTATTGTSRVFQHTKSSAKLQFTGAIDGWWLYSEYPNEDGDDYDFYCFNYEPTGGPWYAVNSVTTGNVPTLTYGTVEPPTDGPSGKLKVAGVSNLPYAQAIDTYKYADGTYNLQSGTGNSRIWKKTDSGYIMYVRYSEFTESWVITSTLDDDVLQTIPYLSKTTYTTDPWDGTTWDVSLDATTCELTLTI